MSPLLAQAPVPVHSDTPTGIWVAVGTMIVMIIGAIGTQLNNHRKDVREAEDRKADNEVQKEIRDCLRQVEVGQTAQNGSLSKVFAIQNEHHTELMRVLPNMCKAQPVLVQQVNQTKKETQ